MEDESEKIERESYGAFEVMKLAVINAMVNINTAYADCLRDSLDGRCPPGSNRKPTKFRELCQAVAQLYYLIRDKLPYIADEKYNKLYELDNYLKNQKSWSEIELADVMEYALLMRSYIEASGLSRFEFKKEDDLTKAKKGMFKS